jgi:Serine/threonine protein kinase
MTDIPISPTPGDGSEQPGSLPYKRIRNAVILPDATKPEPLGSGVITSLLGTGGMSNVYEIWNSQLEMSRAVKLLHPNYTLDSKQRFETEIRITAKLDHPNIVEIHAVGDWNNLPYIEMEKIDGFTLEKLVFDRGGLPVEVCTAIGIMVCRALCYAHSHEYTLYGKEYHGIIHRDLKPNNIMVTKNGSVKLMDFGIAKPIDASIHTTDATAVLGTIQYLSPEQLEGKNVDVRSDIYSLGTVLYELVAGVRAFPETNISKLMISKAKNDFKSLDSFAVRIPPRFKKTIQRCMNHDRRKRVQTSAQLLDVLTEIHKSATPYSPEQVMKQFVNAEGAQKAIIARRWQLPRKIVWAGAGMVGLAVCFVALQHAGLLKAKAPQPARTIYVPVQQQKKVDSLQSFINTMVAKNVPALQPKIQGRPSSRVSGKTLAKGPASDERMMEELKAQYSTSDPVAIFEREVKAGHYSEAQRIFNLLTADQAWTKTASIFHLRLLIGLNDRDEIKKVLFATPLDDGEFYLEKARFYFDGNNIIECLANLDLCAKTPSAFFDQVALRQEIMYYRALCYSAGFDQNPNQPALKKAMDAWFEVKSLFRLSPEHVHFQKAVSEMQRLGNESGKIKG